MGAQPPPHRDFLVKLCSRDTWVTHAQQHDIELVPLACQGNLEGAGLADLCTDRNGVRHGTSIPPPLIRPELIEAIKSDADALVAPQLAALVYGTAQIILQPIFDLESPAIAFGRVALVGDAAFVARPHVASGVMKAAVDAETLVDVLAANSGDVAAALARYNLERQPYGTALVGRGRHIGTYFTVRDGDPRQRMETLMREYGAAGIVRDQPIQARATDSPTRNSSTVR